MGTVLIASVVLVATFVQGATGFGLALVSMPLLVSLLGIQTATPLVALIGIATEMVVLIRYRHALNIRAVAQLSVASVAGIPLGVYLLRRLDADIVTTILGIVIAGFALYALFGPVLPKLVHSGWAFGFGFAGGLLTGAYNTSGPPVIIYGSCRRWPPAEFKGNLQGYFLLNGVMVTAVHAVSGNFTPLIWRTFLTSLPVIVVGLFIGFSLDKRLNPERFRQVVLVVLIFLGVRLIF